MAKSAINRHYDKVHYLRMINNPYYYADSNLPISFGHNKRKISEFICPDDEWFVNSNLRYKQNKIENKEKDCLEELPSLYLNYWEYLESLDEGECDFEDYPIECIATDSNNNYQYSYLLEKPIY